MIKIGKIVSAAKKEDVSIAIMLGIAIVAIVVGVFFLTSWLFMIIEGALGSMFNFRTFGFWQSVVIIGALWFLSMFLGIRRGSSKE